MKAKQLIILSCISIVLFSACETTEKIDDFPLRPSRLVVNCFFTNDSIWEFQVSKSLSVLDNADLSYVQNATVKLFKDSVLIETITELDNNALYSTTSSLPELGHEYSIEVSSPDFEKTLKAKEYSPNAVKVSDVSVIIKDSVFHVWTNNDRIRYGGRVEGSFNILFSDPGGVENYYQLSIFYYDTVYQNYDSEEFYIRQREVPLETEDAAVENNEDNYTRLLLTDKIFDGVNYQIKVDFRDHQPRRDKVYYVKLMSINKSGYLYKKSIDAYNQAVNDPFAEPVQVYSNIENGYGIFSGYSIDIYPVSDW